MNSRPHHPAPPPIQLLPSPERALELATVDLLRRRPHLSAARLLTIGQRVVLGALAFGTGIGLLFAPAPTKIGLTVAALGCLASASLYELLFCVRGVSWRPRISHDRLRDAELPTYTVLVPLYHEAPVVRDLIEALARLDYPAEKLDLKLLVEANDRETIDAVESIPPGHTAELVVVPHGHPKTKPKACNFGLLHARGDYVVIFDAEDRPEPDQLRKAVRAFREGPADLGCVQARLQYWNRAQNAITRLFTAEYAQRFDLLLPGLASAAAPIPLGGTSNHFSSSTLRALGSWDPFNVTEDADLGLRLTRLGLRTVIIDSTTYEEANSRAGSWIRQRSRWVKGWMQTWIVHMRQPSRVWREIGARNWMHCQFLLAGTFIPLLINPLLLGLLFVWALGGNEAVGMPNSVCQAAALVLAAANLALIGRYLAALLRRGYGSSAPYALLAPIYWLLMSIGAWRALYQLVVCPSYWEKTPHGLAGPAPAAEAA